MSLKTARISLFLSRKLKTVVQFRLFNLRTETVFASAWKTGLITCLLHRAKIGCSNCELHTREVKKLCRIFQNNGYPNWFINNVIKNFEENNNTSSNYEKDFKFIIGLPHFGKSSHQFAKKLSNFVKMKFDVDINVYYATLKVGSYFQLECVTPVELVSNVVYKFFVRVIRICRTLV